VLVTDGAGVDVVFCFGDCDGALGFGEFVGLLVIPDVLLLAGEFVSALSAAAGDDGIAVESGDGVTVEVSGVAVDIVLVSGIIASVTVPLVFSDGVVATLPQAVNRSKPISRKIGNSLLSMIFTIL